jgi:pilus assembly protein CpaB
MLLVAALAGLAAVGLAARWLRAQDVQHARIAVAAVDIAPGARLSPPMLSVVEWPRGSVPSGAFAAVDSLDGRVVTSPVQRGEPLIEGRLAPVGARAGLSAVVPPGKRAMTVRVNDVIGVAGFALPGTHVDVLVHTRDEEGGSALRGAGRAVSRIVLERILVLAVAQESDRDASRPKVVNAVTLEVTPQQAERLDLARGVGSLSLVLRNPADDAAVATAGATKVALLGGAAETGRALPQTAPRPSAQRPPSQAPRSSKGVARASIPPKASALPPTPVLPGAQDVVACVDILVGASRRIECF